MQGLRDLGWIDGQNIVIEYRWGVLHETLPKVTRVALLAGTPTHPSWKGLLGAASTLGLTIQSYGWGRDPQEFDRKLRAIAQERAGALLWCVDATSEYAMCGPARELGPLRETLRMASCQADWKI